MLALILLALGILGGAIAGFVVTSQDRNEIRARGTNIGDLVGECLPGQVLRLTGDGLVCTEQVMVLNDLNDVAGTGDPENQQCLCFNETQTLWGPQGPFVTIGDIPSFVNGTTLPCDNLPTNDGGAPLCNALRWGTFAGTWDANTNTPLLSSGGCPFGDFYVVSVDGTTNLDGNDEWGAGDALACSSTGWKRIGKNVPVLSVNGMVGDTSMSLGVLTDVDLTGQADGDFLQRVGGLWTPQQVLLALGDLVNVNTAGASAGDALVSDGSTWLPNSTCCAGGDEAQRQGAFGRPFDDIVLPSNLAFTTIAYTSQIDPGNNMGATTYTAPFDGYYGAWATMHFGDTGAVLTNWLFRARLQMNGSPITFAQKFIRGPTAGIGGSCAAATCSDHEIVLMQGFFRMDAGDTILVQASQTNAQGFGSVFFVPDFMVFTVVFHGPV